MGCAPSAVLRVAGPTTLSLVESAGRLRSAEGVSEGAEWSRRPLGLPREIVARPKHLGERLEQAVPLLPAQRPVPGLLQLLEPRDQVLPRQPHVTVHQEVLRRPWAPISAWDRRTPVARRTEWFSSKRASSLRA